MLKTTELRSEEPKTAKMQFIAKHQHSGNVLLTSKLTDEIISEIACGCMNSLQDIHLAPSELSVIFRFPRNLNKATKQTEIENFCIRLGKRCKIHISFVWK